MVLKGLLDILTEKCEGIATIWVKKVRASPNLIRYAKMTDTELIELNRGIYRQLAQWLAKDIDKNGLGRFFADYGKARGIDGIPVSEISYSLFLAQRSVHEYIANESMIDDAMGLYRMLDITSQVSDFFFLGSYYMLKGYLEDIYLSLNKREALPEDILRTYFGDDFFFKDHKGSR